MRATRQPAFWQGPASGARPATLQYLGQIARSAEQLGFAGALTPTGLWCEDAWLSTAMLAEVTERLKFLVAFRPGLLSPTLDLGLARATDLAGGFAAWKANGLPISQT